MEKTLTYLGSDPDEIGTHSRRKGAATLRLRFDRGAPIGHRKTEWTIQSEKLMTNTLTSKQAPISLWDAVLPV